MAMKVNQENISTQTIDHLGLVAAACSNLGIEEKINQKIGSKDPRRVVQPGKSVIAMILNGLGFTNRRLYLTPQFFQNKAVSQLLGDSYKSDDFNDKTLGKTLDEISNYGATRLYGEIAFEICHEQKLFDSYVNIDTTSFSLEGQYNKKNPAPINENQEECPTQINITHGYSKDHRPDLKQAMLSLTTTGSSSIPIWMEPLDGNSSDKVNFHNTIDSVREFQKQIKDENNFCWIADSALYTPDKLLSYTNFNWICRVPETIKSCKEIVRMPDECFEWKELEDGYRATEFGSSHGGINQRWVLIFSEHAYNREVKTLNKKIEKELEEASKECDRLSRQMHGCKEAAGKEAEKLSKKYKFYNISYSIDPVVGYAGSGRPSLYSQKCIKGYRLNFEIKRNEIFIKNELNRKGRFVIATNNVNFEDNSARDILDSYKSQQNVERGFRFIKDPWFMIDSFFVKKISRISSLMMIMTLCLMVYNYAQKFLRSRLSDCSESLPNQKNKPTQKPTLRWIFQIMEGISYVRIEDEVTKSVRNIITNIDYVRRKIIQLMGETACSIYGLT